MTSQVLNNNIEQLMQRLVVGDTFHMSNVPWFIQTTQITVFI